MREETKQDVNTHVQHVVNAVEAEKPIINEKINQVTKHVEIPQLHFLSRVADMSVVVQRQVFMVQKVMEGSQMQVVEKTVEGPQFQMLRKPLRLHRPRQFRVQKIVEMPKVQFSDEEVNVPVVAQRQVPMIPNVQKTVEVPQIQYVDKIVRLRRDADSLQEEKTFRGD